MPASRSKIQITPTTMYPEELAKLLWFSNHSGMHIAFWKSAWSIRPWQETKTTAFWNPSSQQTMMNTPSKGGSYAKSSRHIPDSLGIKLHPRLLHLLKALHRLIRLLRHCHPTLHLPLRSPRRRWPSCKGNNKPRGNVPLVWSDCDLTCLPFRTLSPMNKPWLSAAIKASLTWTKISLIVRKNWSNELRLMAFAECRVMYNYLLLWAWICLATFYPIHIGSLLCPPLYHGLCF